MSGNLDDLDFGLSVAYEESLRGLRQVVSELDKVQINVTNLVPSYATLNGVASQLASSSTLPTKLVTTLDSVAAGAELVETSMMSAAFSADLVASSLSKASTVATAAGSLKNSSTRICTTFTENRFHMRNDLSPSWETGCPLASGPRCFVAMEFSSKHSPCRGS